MSNQYELCHSNLKMLARDFEGIKANRNEATTRLQLIDRLFFDCLGWSKSDCIAEEPHNNKYADYTFLAPRRILIVEAKREGNYFEVPAGSTHLEYTIPSLIRDNPNLDHALQQVARYCQSRGVLFGAITNGHQIVAFVATRSDNPPLEGRALVFPSLDFIATTHFLDFWNALSKLGIQEKRLETRLVGHAPPVIPTKLSASLPDYPGTKARNKFQTDLKIVSELVLEDVATARELEPTFLKEGYCESGALSECSLISRDILQARYTALFDTGAPGPTTTPAVNKKGISRDLFAQSLSRRPILLLGDVGVGKTTFLRYLMNVGAPEQFANAITLHLNLGTQATLAMDLRLFVITEITRQLREEYDVDIEEQNLVRGIYHGELQRFSRGIYASLRETNPELYAEKELAFLEAKLSDKAEHLKNALMHLEKARHKQIIIFLDNADQRDHDTQQQAFLIAQELASHCPVTVFITLRPETFHLSLRSGGTLSGYHPKAFTIAPPRIDRVLEKRLRFGLRITRGELSLHSLHHVNVQLVNLENIILPLLETLSDRTEIGELIDNIAGGNIRLALDLVQSFFGSGHIDTQKIVNIYTREKRYYIPIHEFLRAVIYGDSVYYDPTRSYVCNLFDVTSSDPKEHFILSLILSQLAEWKGPGINSGFVETSFLYDRIQGMGFRPEQIDAALVRAHRHNLIVTSARRVPEQGQELPPSIRATTVGIYHVKRLVEMFTYIDAIVVDTPIFDRKAKENIHDQHDILERLYRAEIFCGYLDDQWKLVSEHAGPFHWTHASYELQADINRIRQKQSG